MQNPSSVSYLVATKGILHNNRLLTLALKVNISHYNSYSQSKYNQAVLAWGQKKSRQKADKLAKQLNLPLYTVEDGFLRSLDSGTQSCYGASFVLDKTGIYFDLNQSNDLQTMIFQTIKTWNETKRQKSQYYIKKIIDKQLSKYNHTLFAPNLNELLNEPLNDSCNHILVVDQVSNDASIAGAGAVDDNFYQMLSCAIKDNPRSAIWIKSHPAGKGILTSNHQLSHRAKNHLKRDNIDDKKIHIIKQNVNPIALLNQVDKVYTVSSHMGFEALFLKKQVYCFGVNWYSGFGLTDDSFILNKKLYQDTQLHYQKLGDKNPDIHQLFYASYIQYSHYANPATQKPCDIDEVIEYLALNRDAQIQFSGHLLAYQISGWKKSFIKGFVDFPDNYLKIKSKKIKLFWCDDLYQKRTQKMDNKELSFRAFDDNWNYIVWGQKNKKTLKQKLHQINHKLSHKIFCMEDGFIRSNGLGATLLDPVSVVLDDIGIYYDANEPSKLENILVNIWLSDEQKERANKLKESLLKNGVSKYNVGHNDQQFFEKINQLKQQKNCSIHLVIGQVEDDASVQNSLSCVQTNGELLTKVRQIYPNDIVIYKPHPDIEAGLRVGEVALDALQCADVIAQDIAISECLLLLGERDKVHTISSLSGFEALVRGLNVVCYGLPFYAGFGLTEDIDDVKYNHTKRQAVFNRRKRSPLTIEELIFATLIDYPLYHLPHGYGLATPEQTIEFLYKNDQPKQNFAQKSIRKVKTKFMQFRRYITKKQ